MAFRHTSSGVNHLFMKKSSEKDVKNFLNELMTILNCQNFNEDNGVM